MLPGHYLPSELVHHPLQPVADAKHGEAEFEDLLIGRWRVRVIDRAGSARQDNADRILGLDLFEFGCAGEDDGENVQLANATRDELRVLRAEVEDDDAFESKVFHVLASQIRWCAVKRSFQTSLSVRAGR